MKNNRLQLSERLCVIDLFLGDGDATIVAILRQAAEVMQQSLSQGGRCFLVRMNDRKGSSRDPRQLIQDEAAWQVAQRAWALGLGGLLDASLSWTLRSNVSKRVRKLTKTHVLLGAYELWAVNRGLFQPDGTGKLVFTTTQDDFEHWRETDFELARARASIVLSARNEDGSLPEITTAPGEVEEDDTLSERTTALDLPVDPVMRGTTILPEAAKCIQECIRNGTLFADGLDGIIAALEDAHRLMGGGIAAPSFKPEGSNTWFHFFLRGPRQGETGAPPTTTVYVEADLSALPPTTATILRKWRERGGSH
jgi:hypothetical protein